MTTGYEKLTDEQLEEQFQNTCNDIQYSTQNTGSAHYGFGGYIRIARQRLELIREEKSKRKKLLEQTKDNGAYI